MQRINTNADIAEALGIIFVAIALIIATLGAWARHVVWTVTTLASDEGVTIGQAALGVVGGIVPPIGIVHGWAIWLGYAM